MATQEVSEYKWVTVEGSSSHICKTGTWEAGTDKESVCTHMATACILGAKGLQLRDTQGPIGISTINNQFKFSSLAGLYWRPVPSRMPIDHPLCPVQGSSNTLEEKVRQGKGGWTGQREKKAFLIFAWGTHVPQGSEKTELCSHLYILMTVSLAPS